MDMVCESLVYIFSSTSLPKWVCKQFLQPLNQKLDDGYLDNSGPRVARVI